MDVRKTVPKAGKSRVRPVGIPGTERGRALRDFDDDAEDTGIWDKRTKKTVIGAFIFFAAGLFLAWEFGNINGNNPEQRPADAAAREETYWNCLLYTSPSPRD